MDRDVKQLKHIRFPIVKVRWNSQRGPEYTWECEDKIRTCSLRTLMTPQELKFRDGI